MDEHFPKAPLIEVVFEIRFPPDLEIDSLKGKYYNKVRDRFPNLLLPNDPLEPNLLHTYRLESKDRNSIIQFSVNRFSFHAKKYIRFENFKKQCLEELKIFCEFVNLKILERTGLRYINQIPILRNKDGVLPIKNYLNFGFDLPEKIPSKIEELQTSFLTQIGKGSLKVQLRHLKNNDALKSEFLILDFDYILQKGPLEARKVEDYLNESHDHTKPIFISLVSADYLKIMRGQSDGQ